MHMLEELGQAGPAAMLAYTLLDFLPETILDSASMLLICPDGGTQVGCSG